MVIGGDLSQFLNLPSALIVLGVGFGAVVFGHGLSSLELLFQATFSEVMEGQGSIETAAEAAETAAKSFACAGWLGTLVGCVQMLARLDDPAAIGPAVAVALLTALYGHAASALVWMPTERRLRARLASSAASPRRLWLP